MCSRYQQSKEVVSTETNVETKSVPVGNGSVQKITTTTTKTTFSDGSSSTSTETRTVTETTGTNCSRSQTISSSCPHAQKEESKTKSVDTTTGVTHDSHDSSSDSDDDTEFSVFQRQALKTHNEYRKTHGASPLKLNKNLCQLSQNWANNIASRGTMQHNNSGYGENIYWTSGNIGNGKVPVDAWYSEIKDYRFGNQGFSSGTGHFTQVVWKGSKEFGISEASGRNGTYVVANYDPAGNFQGQFNQNVSPPLH